MPMATDNLSKDPRVPLDRHERSPMQRRAVLDAALGGAAVIEKIFGKKDELAETKRALAEAQAEVAKLKQRDGSLFDLKRDSADNIAGVIASTCTDYKTDKIERGLARRRKARKVPKPAG
jgi:hypothetical protein